MLRPLGSLAVVMGALLSASLAAADERPLEAAVSMVGDDECVDRSTLVAEVAAWLGRERVAVELGVVVEAAGTTGSFTVTRGGAPIASRAFDRLPRGCADRRAVLALAIALALDAAILESLGIVVPAAPEEPPEAPPHEPPAEPRPPAGERPALSVEAEALLLIEVLPEVALGGAASIAALVGSGVRIRAGILATQRVGISFDRGGADLSLLAGRLDACFDRAVTSGLLLGGCVGALAGAVLAEGRGYELVRTTQIPWIGAAARAELRWLPWDVLALTLGIEGIFAIVRPRLDVGDGAGGVLDARSVPAAGIAIAIGAALVIE